MISVNEKAIKAANNKKYNFIVTAKIILGGSNAYK
jgi:hypothetical protein